MNSFFSYVPGKATQSYQAEVDEAAALAERQKQQVDPMYHEKIDQLLDTYARKLAENINRRNEIAARVPSILVAGGSNFPVRKKEKQNRADDAAMEEYRQIRGLLDKICGTGRGGISADDPEAVQKLKIKLAGLERDQEKMKGVNAYYRKHKTLEGCPELSAEEVEKLKAAMARDWRKDPKPYPSFHLTNNNAMIRQTKKRIEELSAKAETEYEGWAFEGGEVQMDRESNRLRVFFHEKPDRDTCSAMRHSGFKWAPSVGAWQRQLTDNAIYAAKHLDCLRPLSGEQPVPEQAKPVQGPAQGAAAGWNFYIIPDLKTWADYGADRSDLERFSSFEAVKARFDGLRGEPYNSETVEPGPDGQPPARLTLGIESADGMSAVDILHVRQLYDALADVEALAEARRLYEEGFSGMEAEAAKYVEASALLDGCGIPRERLTAEKADIYRQLAEINRSIRAERRKLALCREIQERVPKIKQSIEKIEMKEKFRDEHRRR